MQAYNYEDIKHVVRHVIKPFGVAHGSEKQGGQHEGTMSSVQWPVSFVVSLVLDGKDANVVNIWNYHDVEAGNDLVLRLKAVPLPPGGKYTLNHYPKSLTEKSFTSGLIRQMTGAPNVTHVWQLVPDIFSLDMESPDELFHDFGGLNPLFLPRMNNPLAPDLAWQQEGYWHIARAQIHSKKYGLEAYYYNDLANNLRTGHMDVTFQPIFCAAPYRDFADQNTPAVRGRAPVGVQQPNVFNLLGSGVGDKRSRQQMLHLDHGYGEDGVLSLSGGVDLESFDSGFPRRSKNNGSTIRVNQYEIGFSKDYSGCGPTHVINNTSSGALMGAGYGSSMPASTVVDSGLAEDIGFFDDPGPLMVPITSSMTGSAAAETGPPPFSVAKPGLKSSAARKSASRGKGVPSSVLAADGSVTQQQASLL
jgi:hypothetical protein